jgi:hypothetical protein
MPFPEEPFVGEGLWRTVDFAVGMAVEVAAAILLGSSMQVDIGFIILEIIIVSLLLLIVLVI